MEEFTFVAMTYNHENYILEHLESIKYQIEHYGRFINNYFILSDDCSTDGTVKKVRNWIEQNKKLFIDSNLIISEKNMGTVSNYIKSMQNIHTHYFKILSGDDLYYTNNMYDVINTTKFVITPTLKFNETQVFGGTSWLYMKFALLETSKKIKSFFKKYLMYKNQIEAPGVFYNKRFVDDDFFQALKDYRLIEDVAVWNYIVHKDESVFLFVDTPFIMYRIGSGISTSKQSPLQDAYITERDNIRKKIFIDYSRYPTKINPYSYWYKLMELYYKCIGKKKKKLRKLRKALYKEAIEAKTYLETLKERANTLS